MHQLSRWMVLTLLLIGGVMGGWAAAQTVDNETEIGRTAARDLEERHGLYNDASANARLQRIAALMVRASASSSAFQFRVLDINEPNGIALPGGFIYLTKGLLKLLPEDELLAAALGHEIAHIALGHMTEMLRERTQPAPNPSATPHNGGKSAAPSATPGAPGTAGAPPRESGPHAREKAADRAAARYLVAAGVDPRASLRLLARLSRQPELNATGSVTHPTWSDRMRVLESYLSSVQFQDDVYSHVYGMLRPAPRPSAAPTDARRQRPW